MLDKIIGSRSKAELTTVDAEVDGGNLDLFENQEHEKNDGPIFHAGFRSKPKSKAIHHGGKRRDTEEVKGQSNGI